MLTFQWKVRDRSTLHVTLAFFGLVLVMVAFFLIFRISYPALQRASATPQRILVLDPTDPAALAIIHRAEDKSFGLFPAESRGAATDGIATSFTPSFAGATLSLREMAAAPATPRYPRLFTPTTSVLPIVPPRATLPPSDPPRSILHAVPGTEIARRAPASTELPDIALDDPQGVQFRVSIGSAGQVIVALPLTAVDDAALMKSLHDAICRLHFTPDPKKPQEWGTLSFRWENPPAP